MQTESCDFIINGVIDLLSKMRKMQTITPPDAIVCRNCSYITPLVIEAEIAN